MRSEQNVKDCCTKSVHILHDLVKNKLIMYHKYMFWFLFSGTNNARLAAMLRQLAVYHQKDPNNLFMVRLAQGLTHLGKGTLTLCPYHSDKALMSPVAVAGLMAVVTACLDVKTCKSSALMETFFSESFY